MATIIGRQKEKKELERLYNSDKAEFTAIYGRRRIGKTFLIKQFFKDRFAFCHTGLSPIDAGREITKEEQIQHFVRSLHEYGMEETQTPTTWIEVFYMLERLLKRKANGKKQVVFIDELPWMDTPDGGLLTGIEQFWNSWGNWNDNLLFIVCGSATSWMQSNLFDNYGGLYGRLTYRIYLKPFTLGEVEQYLNHNGIALGRMDIAMAYMAFGGVPYYLNFLEKGLSLAQNIDMIIFCKNAALGREFDVLFKSQFRNHEMLERVVRRLGERNYGYSRKEISEATGITSGKRLGTLLDTLVQSNFIEQYKPFDANGKEMLYRLTDPFCCFYLKFCKVKNEHFWQESQHGGMIKAWMGIAFERLCLLHIDKIKQRLGISGMQTDTSTYTLRGDENHDGMQCDMIIIRKDNIVNLCEMKFTNDIFTIDRSYYQILQHRISLLAERLRKRQTIHLTFVTSNGVKFNEYSGIVQSFVELDDLF